jgi:signal transduction histidine kinase
MPRMELILPMGLFFVLIVSYLVLSDAAGYWFTALSLVVFIADLVVANLWRPAWFPPIQPMTETTISLVFCAAAFLIVQHMPKGFTLSVICKAGIAVLIRGHFPCLLYFWLRQGYNKPAFAR